MRLEGPTVVRHPIEQVGLLVVVRHQGDATALGGLGEQGGGYRGHDPSMGEIHAAHRPVERSRPRELGGRQSANSTADKFGATGAWWIGLPWGWWTDLGWLSRRGGKQAGTLAFGTALPLKTNARSARRLGPLDERRCQCTPPRVRSCRQGAERPSGLCLTYDATGAPRVPTSRALSWERTGRRARPLWVPRGSASWCGDHLDHI